MDPKYVHCANKRTAWQTLHYAGYYFISRATPTCPVCRADKVEDRFSVVAGKIADLLEVECANLEQGCTVKLLRPSLEEHEAACIYTQNLKCPNAEAYGCKVKVSVANCVEHIITCRIYDWCGQVNVNFPSRIPLYFRVPFHNDGWNHRAMPLKVFGTHDHIIVVGENHGDNTMIFAKCLSADRSRRYSLKLELNSPKLGQSKSNSGKTLLMTENLADSLEDGNVLLIHSKNFLKFKETGMAEVVITIDRKTEPVHKEAMEEGGKPPGTKRKMTDDKADKSNKKSQ